MVSDGGAGLRTAVTLILHLVIDTHHKKNKFLFVNSNLQSFLQAFLQSSSQGFLLAPKLAKVNRVDQIMDGKGADIDKQ